MKLESNTPPASQPAPTPTAPQTTAPTDAPDSAERTFQPAPTRPAADTASAAVPQPVAYDRDGNPLYAAPPQPQVVYVTRAADPGETRVPDDVAQRHDASHKKYPQLNLSEAEYVITDIPRHPFGAIQIWITAIVLIAALAGLLAAFAMNQPDSSAVNASGAIPLAIAGVGLISIFILAGAFVASYVFNRNKFYLTNESIIQEIQNGLFNRREQTVSLGSIEDASYHQDNLLESMLNYGSIRLSTVGDETTYRFTYVANPRAHIATLNNAVEDFKNGRRVGD